MKDLSEVNQYLETQINKTEESYTPNQKLKLEELTKKFNLENAEPTSTPMQTGFNLLEDDDNLLQNITKFRQAIG